MCARGMIVCRDRKVAETVMIRKILKRLDVASDKSAEMCIVAFSFHGIYCIKTFSIPDVSIILGWMAGCFLYGLVNGKQC